MRLKNERHELKKQAQAAVTAKTRVEGRAFFPVFQTMFAEELAKSAAAKEEKPPAAQAA
jgi:hypothetical protein